MSEPFFESPFTVPESEAIQLALGDLRRELEAMLPELNDEGKANFKKNLVFTDDAKAKLADSAATFNEDETKMLYVAVTGALEDLSEASQDKSHPKAERKQALQRFNTVNAARSKVTAFFREKGIDIDRFLAGLPQDDEQAENA